MTMVPPAAILPHSRPSSFMKLTTATGAVIAAVRVGRAAGAGAALARAEGA